MNYKVKNAIRNAVSKLMVVALDLKAPYTLSVEVHGRFGAIWVAVFDGQEAIAMPDTIGTMFSIKLPKTIDEIGLFSDVVNATIDIIKAEIK